MWDEDQAGKSLQGNQQDPSHMLVFRMGDTKEGRLFGVLRLLV